MNADFGDVSIIVSHRDAERIWNKIEEIDEVDAAQQAKLDTIEEGAEVNVQADWNETETEEDDFIKNKPVDITSSEIDEIINGLD